MAMKINQIESIKSDAGPWVVLGDYYTEGLHVLGQFESAQDAVDHIAKANYQPCAILYLPNIVCQGFLPEHS